jgi:hypothetical protein
MPFTLQYNKLIESEKSVSKTNIIPRNLYRINSYTYADGTKKNLSGAKSTIVFVFGKDAQTIYGLKVNEIKPDKFFLWLKTILVKTPIDWKTIQELDEAIILSDKAGSKLFNSYIKGKPIYNNAKPTYRTYTIKGISNIERIYLKKDVLEQELS